MGQYNPKVSIVIPVYNGSNYLAEAIDSALSQTYKNIEVIVVNDGSCDHGKTDEVALRYGDRIRYFCKENGGSSSALNYGIKQMTGEWFSWLSHDDLYYPEKIEEQINYICEKELYKTGAIEKHLFFTASENIDECGNSIRRQSPRYIQNMFCDVGQIRDNKYLVANPIKYNFNGCGCLIHKSALENVGGFDENLRLVNDVDMWFRLYINGYTLHYIPIILVKGRIHKNQISRSVGFSYHNAEQDMFWQRSLTWLKNNCDFETDYDAFYQFGKIAYEKTRNVEGSQAFQAAATIRPNKKKILTITAAVTKMRAAVLSGAKKMYLKIKL